MILTEARSQSCVGCNTKWHDSLPGVFQGLPLAAQRARHPNPSQPRCKPSHTPAAPARPAFPPTCTAPHTPTPRAPHECTRVYAACVRLLALALPYAFALAHVNARARDRTRTRWVGWVWGQFKVLFQNYELSIGNIIYQKHELLISSSTISNCQ